MHTEWAYGRSNMAAPIKPKRCVLLWNFHFYWYCLLLYFARLFQEGIMNKVRDNLTYILHNLVFEHVERVVCKFETNSVVRPSKGIPPQSHTLICSHIKAVFTTHSMEHHHAMIHAQWMEVAFLAPTTTRWRKKLEIEYSTTLTATQQCTLTIVIAKKRSQLS